MKFTCFLRGPKNTEGTIIDLLGSAGIVPRYLETINNSLYSNESAWPKKGVTFPAVCRSLGIMDRGRLFLLPAGETNPKFELENLHVVHNQMEAIVILEMKDVVEHNNCRHFSHLHFTLTTPARLGMLRKLASTFSAKGSWNALWEKRAQPKKVWAYMGRDPLEMPPPISSPSRLPYLLEQMPDPTDL